MRIIDRLVGSRTDPIATTACSAWPEVLILGRLIACDTYDSSELSDAKHGGKNGAAWDRQLTADYFGPDRRWMGSSMRVVFEGGRWAGSVLLRSSAGRRRRRGAL